VVIISYWVYNDSTGWDEEVLASDLIIVLGYYVNGTWYELDSSVCSLGGIYVDENGDSHEVKARYYYTINNKLKEVYPSVCEDLYIDRTNVLNKIEISHHSKKFE